MNTSHRASQTDVAPAPAPAPQLDSSFRDDQSVASAVLNSVLDVTDLSDELRDIADSCIDESPESAAHVLDLSEALARTVLDWIARWPA